MVNIKSIILILACFSLVVFFVAYFTYKERVKDVAPGEIGAQLDSIKAASKKVLAARDASRTNADASDDLDSSVLNRMYNLSQSSEAEAIEYIRSLPEEEVARVDKHGDTYLRFLLAMDSEIPLSVVKVLLERGASLDPKVPIERAASRFAEGSLEREIISLDPYREFFGSGNFLHYICATSFDTELLDWFVSEVDAGWLENNINVYDRYGMAPIHYVGPGSPEVASRLVDHGADVNAYINVEDGRNVLGLCVERGYGAYPFIKLGADPDKPMTRGASISFRDYIQREGLEALLSEVERAIR